MSEDTSYILTEKGWEMFWRAKIAEEVRYSHMPICVCERCGNLREGAMVERIMETIKGRP